MPNPVNKIEDLLEKVSASIDFDPHHTESSQVDDSSADISFPQVLDFAFPDEFSSENLVQIGEITYVGDGVIHAAGLEKATIDEIVEIKTEFGIEKALILGVTESKVEGVVLGDYSKIKRGDEVRSTGKTLSIAAGMDIVGRVLDPLGNPLDSKGPLKADDYRPVEFPAPGVMDREPVKQALRTGVMVIDIAVPLGRGQRELVIGDRKTGKTRTALDIICNQKGQGVYCVYVGVSVQAAKAKATLKMLNDRGAMAYTTVVLALANDPPTKQYIAPYVGSAIAEQLMYHGKHVLIIYDDLSKQAKAYRQVSLLMKRSPGRDAYPGDIFFLHSRLLERASKLHRRFGGGSITALPVAETQAGDVSDYIITNLMSITDGHIYLDTNLMHEGILPAVDSATSVSRIGGVVQTPLQRKVSELTGRILARYNEVKSFETINTEVAEDTIRDIKRGKRLKEILAQDSSLNLTPDEQVIMLGIGTSSRMDHLELEHAVTFKTKIIPFYREKYKKDLQEKIDTTKELKDVDSHLDEIFISFCKGHKIPLLER